MDDSPRQPTERAEDRSLWTFFLLVIALSIPFWSFGFVDNFNLLPGLPVAALSAVCPGTAAAILMYRRHGWAGVVGLLKRSYDYRRVTQKAWFAPTVLIMPIVMILSFVLMRLDGIMVPAPDFSVLTVVALCAVFFVGAVGEELGWTAYATEPMISRWGVLRGALILGVIWASWHLVALAQENRSLTWMLWWALGTVAARVIMVCLFTRTGGSVVIAALFHMSVNATWQLFPVRGSFYDPFVTSLILVAVAGIMVLTIKPRMERTARPSGTVTGSL